jgi:Carboxypeptidase regulatory-like domain
MLLLAAGVAVVTLPASAQQPPRDTSVQPVLPTGRITGRVVAADNGRPLKRARVLVSSSDLPGGRAALTDESGVFDITELPAGRYTIQVSKTGFVSLSYGQRRPLQAGTPLQLGNGQQLRGVDFQLPRGSAVAGRIFDEDGEPMPGVSVSVSRYEYLQGDRRLVPAGSGQTDDKGQYRIWGLMPGDYYVSATARNLASGAFGRGFGGRGFAAFGRGGVPGDADQPTSYAPTYYPGVESVDQSKPIAVGLSQEVLDISFGLMLVRTSRVTGHATSADGTPATSGTVQLLADGSTSRGQIGTRYGGRIQWDGRFTISNVPPGRYVLQARSDDGERPLFGTLPMTVAGGETSDVGLVLAPGATITGTVSFPAGSTPPDLSQIRIAAPALEQGIGGPQQSRVDKDGNFTLDGISVGMHFIRPQNAIRGWMLKSVTAGGRDITDTPIELRSGQRLSGLVITFTDRVTEIAGTVTNAQGAAATEFTVLAFPTDTSMWRAQARQIMTARPDQTGKYTIRALPPGSYYVVAVDPSEQGEWFEPAYLEQQRTGASEISIAEGDSKTLDLRVR